MELLLVLLLIIGGLVGYPYLQDARENRFAKRLESLRDSGAASAEVDAMIARSKAEAEGIRRFGSRGL